MEYILQPTQNDILHYGVDHLHSKNGRGSGRYPWGSGKQPSNKKVTKKGAGKHIRDLRNQAQDEYTKSEQNWDMVMDGIIRSGYDSKREKALLDMAIDESLSEHLSIYKKYNNMVEKYLIDTGLANEKMSSKEIQKMANKLEQRFLKDTSKKLDKHM